MGGTFLNRAMWGILARLSVNIRRCVWLVRPRCGVLCHGDVAAVGSECPDRKHRVQGEYATKRDAERALVDVLGRLDIGSYVEPTKQTVSDFPSR